MSKRKRLAEPQLLRTKLYVPSPGEDYVARPRLVARLNASLRVPLTVLAAPAGFGKTTLVAAWAGLLKAARTAWLTLEVGDDESTRFLTYLCAALRTVDQRLGTDAMSLLQAVPPVPPQLVLTSLINSFPGDSEPTVLVLDDAHVLESDTAGELLAFLIEHAPPNLHLVLATRTDPNLPLARFRARGKLNELRAHDLRFTHEEATAFLNEAMLLELEQVQVRALESRTEGWIAGLHLAALSLRGRTDRAQFIAAFHGSHRFILDYLMEQVLSQQTDAVQRFLLETSILERMNAPLCRAVTEQPAAQAHLEWLEAHNLFLVPLDDAREWYRYHRLFADALQHRLRQGGASEIQVLHRRASRWFAAQGYYEEAVHHARASGDLETIAQILEQHGTDILLSGHPLQIEQWLDALPEEMIATRPLVAATQGILFLLTDRLERGGARLQLAERLLEQQRTEPRLGFVRAWNAIARGEFALQTGNLAALVAVSRKGLEETPEGEPARLPLLVRVARAFQYTGDVTGAREQELEATFPLVQRTRNLYTQLNSVVYLARLQTLQGNLNHAMDTFARAPRLMSSSGTTANSVIHPGYGFGRAAILYEWNRLDEASRELENGFAMTFTELSIDADVLMLGYTTKIQLQCALQDFEGAHETMVKLTHVAAERRFFPGYLAEIDALRAHVAWVRGNRAAAFRWHQSIDFSATEAPTFPREPVMTMWARVALGRAEQDRSPELLREIQQVLARWGADAGNKERRNSVIAILVLRARLASAQGERRQAFDLLEQALAPGEPENYLRVFADQDEPFRQLLLAYSAYGSVKRKAYVQAILAAFGDSSASRPGHIRESPLPMVDGLSAREIQVLRLIAGGASNQEIAAALVIALPTVKRHISTIYDKLGVTSRTQAVARARERNLF